MKRFIAQFKTRSNCEDLYVVMDTSAGGGALGDPKPYHAANDEAEARNNGTWATPTFDVDAYRAAWTAAVEANSP